MTVVNIANGIDVITEGCIPLDSNFIRESVNSIVEQDQFYVAKRKRIQAQKKRNNQSILSRLTTVICSL